LDKIDQLRGIVEFVAAAEAGSFSAAARTLDVSVAHISRTVRDLEQRIGAQLILRTTRQSTLTDAGREFFDHCRTSLDGIAEARERLQSGQGALRGPIRISMNGYFAETRVAPLLAAFALTHPQVSLDVELSSRNVALVEEGFDLAIRAGPLVPSTLIAKCIARFPLITVASPAFLEKTGHPTSPHDLDPALCLPLGTRSWSFNDGQNPTTIRPQGAFGSNSGTILLRAAATGLGFAQLPAYYGRSELTDKSLITVLDSWMDGDHQFEFYIVYPAQRHISTRLRALIDHLASALA